MGLTPQTPLKLTTNPSVDRYSAGDGVAPNFGGTGLDTSASVGIPSVFPAGVWNVNSFPNLGNSGMVLAGPVAAPGIVQTASGVLSTIGAAVASLSTAYAVAIDPLKRWVFVVDIATAFVGVHAI